MIAVAAGRPSSSLSHSLVALSIFAALIAWAGPFDVVIRQATFGQPALRVALILAMIAIGGYCAGKVSLHIEGVGARTPLLIGALAAFLTAMYIVLVDGFLFRSALPQDYVFAVQHISLSRRLIYYFMRAYQESVIYRLFLFSMLLYGLALLRSGKPIPAWQLVSAMIGVQAVNVLLNTVPMEPLTPQMLLYEAARYLVPGSVWGWLYWRFGFSTLEVAHVGSHAFLQPALTVLI